MSTELHETRRTCPCTAGGDRLSLPIPTFLEPHDLAIAKIGASREKDLGFVNALIRADLLSLATLRQRCALVPDDYSFVRERIKSFLASYSK
ncbi:MAG TPA: hypothetical protein VK086_07920 [Ruania sp.]|nr:hypothetical protein [Ruania sp.]